MISHALLRGALYKPLKRELRLSIGLRSIGVGLEMRGP